MKIRIALIVAFVAGLGVCAPKPSLAPKAGIWTLDVVFSQPMQYSQRRDDGKLDRYWYTTLTLVNNSGADVPFYPKFELFTDTWQTLSSDTGITKDVYSALKRINAGAYPFLETLDEVDNVVLQGADNAIDLLVVWKDFDVEAKNVKMFFAGLSNETKVVEYEKDGKKQSCHLQKTLELSYSIPGDKAKRGQQNLVFEDKQWIMR